MKFGWLTLKSSHKILFPFLFRVKLLIPTPKRVVVSSLTDLKKIEHHCLLNQLYLLQIPTDSIRLLLLHIHHIMLQLLLLRQLPHFTHPICNTLIGKYTFYLNYKLYLLLLNYLSVIFYRRGEQVPKS